MGRSSVAAEIARLEAISIIRELDGFEVSRLARLVTAQRRYDYSRARHRGDGEVPPQRLDAPTKIARLEEISRGRPLDQFEVTKLERLIATERRAAASRTG